MHGHATFWRNERVWIGHRPENYRLDWRTSEIIINYIAKKKKKKDLKPEEKLTEHIKTWAPPKQDEIKWSKFTQANFFQVDPICFQVIFLKP